MVFVARRRAGLFVWGQASTFTAEERDSKEFNRENLKLIPVGI
jgi:hypothetical protein